MAEQLVKDRVQQAKELAEEQMEKDEKQNKEDRDKLAKKGDATQRRGKPEGKYFPPASVVQPIGGDVIVEPVFSLTKDEREGNAPGLNQEVGPFLSEEDKKKAAEEQQKADTVKAGIKSAVNDLYKQQTTTTAGAIHKDEPVKTEEKS